MSHSSLHGQRLLLALLNAAISALVATGAAASAAANSMVATAILPEKPKTHRPTGKAGAVAADQAPDRMLDRILVCCSGGLDRVCYLRLPAAYDGAKRLPLVLLLHGMGGTALSVEEYTGMGQKADTAGFILACPEAAGDPSAWSVGLNSGLRNPGDVQYLSSLIDELERTLAVDPDRVYVAGHSSGAMMAYRLAAERSEKIAAIAVVAGTIGARTVSGSWTMLQAPSHPVSLIVFHGTDDPTMPYSDRSTRAFNDNFLPGTTSAVLWAKEIGCSPVDVKSRLAGGQVVRDIYAGGRNGSEVVLYSIVGGDHWWPGDTEDAPYIAAADQSLNATDLIWDFFSHHRRTLKARH